MKKLVHKSDPSNHVLNMMISCESKKSSCRKYGNISRNKTNLWKAIKLSDGMFDDGNVGYYKRASDSDNVLHYIIHYL